MAFGSDVKAVRTAFASLPLIIYAGPARVKGVYFATNGVAGTINLIDGGSGGTVRVVLDAPLATSTAPCFVYVQFPDDGVRFYTNIYLSATTAVVLGVTVFYG